MIEIKFFHYEIFFIAVYKVRFLRKSKFNLIISKYGDKIPTASSIYVVSPHYVTSKALTN
jgi:hypothetical protein